jgi:hypothetical protein
MDYEHLSNCFFPYSKSKKAVISLVFAHKGGFKKHRFSNRPYGVCYKSHRKMPYIRQTV